VNTRPIFVQSRKDRIIWYHAETARWIITKKEWLESKGTTTPQNGQPIYYAILEEEDIFSPELGEESCWKVWDSVSESMKECCLEVVKEAGCKLWCSTLRRTIQTSSCFKRVKAIRWRALSEIEVGTCDGLTYQEIKDNFPDEYRKRQEDKLFYRYPSGESYKDVIQRLEPVIFELERSKLPVFVVGHRAVLRCLYGYFVGTPEKDIPHLDIPLHEVRKLSPGPYGTEVTRYTFGTHTTNSPSQPKAPPAAGGSHSHNQAVPSYASGQPNLTGISPLPNSGGALAALPPKARAKLFDGVQPLLKSEEAADELAK